MARKSEVEKANTRERLVAEASRAFRKYGVNVSIGDLMEEIGMTHGGFYRHFASKEDLLMEAVAYALREIADHLDQIGRRAEVGHELEAIITSYLSEEHLRHPEAWCALAALSPDMSRLPAAIRQRLGEAMQYYRERICPYLPGRTREEQAMNFVLLFSAMAGSIAMLRVLPDPASQVQLLAATRKYYLETFARKQDA